MNKWEKLFEEFLDSIDFCLMKHKEKIYVDEEGETHEGIWSLIDRQGANWGGIEEDRFFTVVGIIDRLDIYINDSYFNDLEEELGAYNVDLEDREKPWSSSDWLNLRDDEDFYKKNKHYFDTHSFEFDVLDMMANHTDEINLENVYYMEDDE